MNKANELFAKNLNTFMEYYGLSQGQLADRLGYGHSAVSTWCRGIKFPRLSTIDKMTEIFHCTRSDLLEREMDSKTIGDRAKLVRMYAYIDRLNQLGLERVLQYVEDLNPKYFEEGDGNE